MKTTLFLAFILSLTSGCVTLTEHQKQLEAREDKVMQNFEKFGQIYRDAKPTAEQSKKTPTPQQVEPKKVESKTRKRIRVIDAEDLRSLDDVLKKPAKSQEEPGFTGDESADDPEVIVVVEHKR